MNDLHPDLLCKAHLGACVPANSQAEVSKASSQLNDVRMCLDALHLTEVLHQPPGGRPHLSSGRAAPVWLGQQPIWLHLSCQISKE